MYKLKAVQIFQCFQNRNCVMTKKCPHSISLMFLELLLILHACLIITFKYDALIVNLRNKGLQEGLRAKAQMQKLIE